MKRILLFAGIIVLAAGGYFLISYFMVSSSFRHDAISNDLKFDKFTWQRGSNRQRGQMVNFLIDSIGIVGKRKSEIINLMGDPDRANDVPDGEYKSKYYYAVDKGDAYTYDMIIFFDASGQAKSILFDD